MFSNNVMMSREGSVSAMRRMASYQELSWFASKTCDHIALPVQACFLPTSALHHK